MPDAREQRLRRRPPQRPPRLRVPEGVGGRDVRDVLPVDEDPHCGGVPGGPGGTDAGGEYGLDGECEHGARNCSGESGLPPVQRRPRQGLLRVPVYLRDGYRPGLGGLPLRGVLRLQRHRGQPRRAGERGGVPQRGGGGGGGRGPVQDGPGCVEFTAGAPAGRKQPCVRLSVPGVNGQDLRARAGGGEALPGFPRVPHHVPLHGRAAQPPRERDYLRGLRPGVRGGVDGALPAAVAD
mmetsp:Transcript_34953/g.91476  ORF Transcript_34953/g.91476 Transcript_34953/m.91476 type:complete len:237 (-) Transcript_34953:353-1063(-)